MKRSTAPPERVVRRDPVRVVERVEAVGREDHGRPAGDALIAAIARRVRVEVERVAGLVGDEGAGHEPVGSARRAPRFEDARRERSASSSWT